MNEVLPLDPTAARLLFPEYLGRLLTYAATTAGIAVQMGECWRTPEQAQWNARHGKGIGHSLHIERLAVDLLCFRLVHGEWTYLTDGNDPEYKILGTVWKNYHPACRWGGDFAKPDAGHFSLAIDERA
jgi:hypothetical protein